MSLEIKTLQIENSLSKSMLRYTTSLAVAFITSAVITVSSFAACGSLTMAEMNWASAQFMAQVDKVILERGYGCEVELVPGATMTTFASMEAKGTPDVAAEFWANAAIVPLRKAVGEGRLHISNKTPITGLGEGWWISPATAKKHPNLKTVLDIIENPKLFPDKEDPSKGAFVGCPAGWACQLINANLFRAFEMEKKGWVLVDPGSQAGLDGSMSKAVLSGKNWFGYYWTPTSLIGKHKMIKVPFGVPFAGNKNWENCLIKPEQDCANPQKSAWIKSEVYTIVTDKFKKAGGGSAADFLSKRTYPGSVLNSMLVYMADNQAEGSDAAIEFLQNHEDIWTKWVPSNIASKIKSSL